MVKKPAKKEIIKEKRAKTGIPGFDKLCEGGPISDSVNLIIGNAGAGKTTFMIQFLYNGATKFNENGLYISFEPEISDIYRAAKKQGMDLEKLDSENKCKVLKVNGGVSIKEIQEKVIKMIAKYNIKRICLDPINVFAIELPREITIRRQIYDLLSLFKKLDVCVLIAGESDEEQNNLPDTSDEIKFCKYSSDGVIELFSSGISGTSDRAIRITKMRMTNHFRGPVGMEINSSGIKVLNK